MNFSKVASVVMSLAASGNAAAQVSPDGTLGTNVSQSGQTYTISGGTIVNVAFNIL